GAGGGGGAGAVAAPPPAADPSGATNTTGAPQVAVRQFFPETLFVAPSVLTDENGAAQIQVPIADSITSWRMSSLASTLTGLLGSTSAPLRVFQDFFVDIDFPATLMRGDEVSVPIAIYNYLDVPQEVHLTAEASPGFALVDGPEQTVAVDANSVSSATYRVRTLKVGRYDFQV